MGALKALPNHFQMLQLDLIFQERISGLGVRKLHQIFQFSITRPEEHEFASPKLALAAENNEEKRTGTLSLSAFRRRGIAEFLYLKPLDTAFNQTCLSAEKTAKWGSDDLAQRQLSVFVDKQQQNGLARDAIFLQSFRTQSSGGRIGRFAA